MKASDIRNLTDDELIKELASSKQELFNLRIQSRTGQLENFSRVKTVKRTIARFLTEQNFRAKKVS